MNALSTWITGKVDFDAGLLQMVLGVDRVSCVFYDGFTGLEKIRRLASSPPVVHVHTKTRSRST